MKSAALDDDRANIGCPGGNGVFRPTFVVKGRVTGLWKKKETAKRLIVEMIPYSSLSKPVRTKTEQAVRRHGEFCGEPATIAFA